MATAPKTITVIGAGHVGVPHAVTIANKCPNVKIIVCDDDKRKVAAWSSSLLPFYEPGLQEGVEEVREKIGAFVGIVVGAELRRLRAVGPAIAAVDWAAHDDEWEASPSDEDAGAPSDDEGAGEEE